MIDASALASLSLSARNDAMLPGLVVCEALCSAPIMPPSLACMAVFASSSQFEPVLDAIAGVSAIAESVVAPRPGAVLLLVLLPVADASPA
jgi:hypothetical protein